MRIIMVSPKTHHPSTQLFGHYYNMIQMGLYPVINAKVLREAARSQPLHKSMPCVASSEAPPSVYRPLTTKQPGWVEDGLSLGLKGLLYMGVSQATGLPKTDGLEWKIPKKNGWVSCGHMIFII